MRCGQAELSHEETHADTSATSWATAGVNIVKNLVLGSRVPTALLLKRFPVPANQLMNVFGLELNLSSGCHAEVRRMYLKHIRSSYWFQ